MEKEIYPKFKKCPIFINNAFLKEDSSRTYRQLYCEAGKEDYSACKRYIVSEKTGKPVPEKFLPNCLLSVEEIIKRMQL